MPYMFVIGSCVACHAHITFNPSFVPSIRVNGSREPICRSCHARWNEIHRVSKGLAPVEIHPEAYEPEETA
jgi:hypothetical protein